MKTTNSKFLGIEIGGTKIQLFVLDEVCVPIQRVKFEVAQGVTAQEILAQLKVHIEAIKANHIIDGIGVGFGGPVNINSGSIVKSYQVAGWDNFDLKSWLEEIIDVPVVIDNDTNVAALAETVRGAGQEHQHVLYITLGSGVGSGFVIDGNIYRGKNSAALEFGHLLLDKAGTTLESKCSGWGLNASLNDYVSKNPLAPIARLVNEQQKDASKLLLQSIELGDEGALVIFTKLADNLAFGLSHAIHLLAPDIIIIGGGLMGLGDKLLERLDALVPNYLMESLKKTKQLIVLSKLQTDVVPVGAGVLLKQHIIKTNNKNG